MTETDRREGRHQTGTEEGKTTEPHEATGERHSSTLAARYASGVAMWFSRSPNARLPHWS